jgi:hypothetical protein
VETPDRLAPPARGRRRRRSFAFALSEVVVVTLASALDLTEGQPLGHSVRACVIGMRLGGQELGMDDERLGGAVLRACC